MTARAPFAYVQARIQARYGRLAGPGDWSRLERVADFGHLVQMARSTGLAPWLRHVGPESGPHEIELALRHRFRGHVRHVAGWVPRGWRPATEWIGVLPDLPALAHLLNGRPAPAWMRNDPELARLGEAGADERPAILRASPLAPLAGDRADPALLARRWSKHWRSLRPAPPREFEARLCEALTSPVLGARERRFLARTFRRETHRPAAVFAYLALVRDEMDRLRGMLVRRRLLPAAA